MKKHILPKIWGILNITPDSFSDGGNFLQTDLAIKHATHLINKGANVIDVGAESTRPGAVRVPWQEEWSRLESILPLLCQLTKNKGVQISLDSHKYEVIKRALPYIDMINDVSGLQDKNILAIVKDSKIPAILMHNLTVPADTKVTIPEDVDSMDQVVTWFKRKIMLLENAGLQRDLLVLDPGVGFGKKPYQSLHILDNIAKMQDFGLPILVGHSRKGFLKLLTAENMQELDFNTAIVSMYLIHHRVEHIRVHNVALNKKFVDLHKFMDSYVQNKCADLVQHFAGYLKSKATKHS